MKQLILIALIATGLPGISFARAPANKPQEVKLQVTERGFEPNRIDVKPGTDVVLKVTRTTNNTCATAIRIP
jgi:plastocyanin domain-containing protein